MKKRKLVKLPRWDFPPLPRAIVEAFNPPKLDQRAERKELAQIKRRLAALKRRKKLDKK